MANKKALSRLLTTLLARLISIVGVLMLSQEAGATPMLQVADLAIGKPDDRDPVIARQPLTYAITVTNNGPNYATVGTPTDNSSPEAMYVSDTGDEDRINDPAERTVIWDPSNIPDGESERMNIAVEIPFPTLRSTGPHNDVVVTTTTDELDTTITEEVNLAIGKSIPAMVNAGEQLIYTITVTNTGPSDADNVTVTDTLPVEMTFGSATTGCAYASTDHSVICDISTLTADVTTKITIAVTVTSPLVNGTVLTNTAWLDTDQTPPLSVTQETTVRSSPVLTITKTDKPDPATAGLNLLYTIAIANSGNENASSVTVVEDYDPNTSFVYATPPPDPGSEDRRWTFPTLAVDTSETINVVVRVGSPLDVGTVLTNLVILESDQTVPITATELTSVTSVSELTVYKVDWPSDYVPAGDDLRYIIYYQASGTAPAEGVVITETYDSRVTFISASVPPRAGTNNVWDIGGLDANEGGNIIVTVNVETPLSNGTMLTNVVTIDSAYTFPQTFTETTSVSSATDLTFSVTDHPDPVEAGAPLTYTLHYQNAGNADATQVVITATLDASVSFITSSPTPTGGANAVWYWQIDEISGGGSYEEIVIRTAVTLPLTNGTKLDFVAQLGDAEEDSLEQTAQTTVSSTPILHLHKSDGVSTVYAGDRLTYTLTCTNSGNENAYGVTITDTLPNYVAYVSCEVPAGDCQRVQPDGDEVVFHIPSIIAQTYAQPRLVVKVDDLLPAEAAASVITNRAKAVALSLPTPIHTQDTDRIGTLPDLTITVEHTPMFFSPGRPMTYTVTYSNTGRMHAEDVIITTALPTNTIYTGSSDWHTSDGRIHTYTIGDLLAGSTGHTLTFTVEYTKSLVEKINDTKVITVQQISEYEFNTPFTIAAGSGIGGDANPNDNTAHAYIGVPDLVIADFAVEPYPLRPDVPVTFTMVLENQGTGWARNPDPRGGPFWVDVFIAPVASYPWERYSEKDVYHGVNPLEPGQVFTLVITHTASSTRTIQFSEDEVRGEIAGFYAKVDNFASNPYGLVPESNEMNNVAVIDLRPYQIYLPLILRHQDKVMAVKVNVSSTHEPRAGPLSPGSWYACNIRNHRIRHCGHRLNAAGELGLLRR